jgi:hypothetical protein
VSDDYRDVAQDQATRRLMARSDEWTWHLLPLKKTNERDHTGFHVMGFMADPADTDGVVIYLGNIFGPDGGKTGKKKYASIEAAMADGWVVD